MMMMICGYLHPARRVSGRRAEGDKARDRHSSKFINISYLYFNKILGKMKIDIKRLENEMGYLFILHREKEKKHLYGIKILNLVFGRFI